MTPDRIFVIASVAGMVMMWLWLSLRVVSSLQRLERKFDACIAEHHAMIARLPVWPTAIHPLVVHSGAIDREVKRWT